MKLIQFNCKSYFTNLCNIQLLISEQQPDLICLQETRLKVSKPALIKGYNIYSNYRHTNHASGGVSIVAKEYLHSQIVNIHSNLEVIAIEVWLPQKTTICNIYIPPDYHLEYEEIESLILQLPSPFILVGDFNAHNPIWGDNDTNLKGRIMEKILDSFDELILLNDGRPTHFNMTSYTFSAIDLSICHSKLANSINWNPLSNLFGSDHFPIVLNNGRNNPSGFTIQKWKMQCADWNKFETHLNNSNIKINMEADINTNLNNIHQSIIKAAQLSIPVKNISSHHRYNVPWWNSKCATAIKEKTKPLTDTGETGPQKI